ncbi:cytochrome-c peroxidase [Chloroflexota bacterium]
MPRWIWFFIASLGALLLLIFMIGIPPITGDPEINEQVSEAGTVGIEPSWTDLLRPWPDIDTDIDPDLANLGYRLFFDPILSGGNDLSCAHCHHPDKGFSDDRVVAENTAGEQLTRHSSSLWNVAYAPSLFWDGRAGTLEEQIETPLFAANEMDQNPEELIIELEAIDTYAAVFNTLFNDGVTIDNVAAAIAEFERTLISNGAAFDAYAEGDTAALSPQQQRGLVIFGSALTRCGECHIGPAFTDHSFRVVGVPDNGVDDKGRSVIIPGLDYAFKVPTLRNAVLSAPYFHNGSVATIEGVIKFYAEEALKFEKSGVDFQVEMGFDLDEQEKADMVAFLYALVDETIPQEYWKGLNYIDSEGHILIPDLVPSGSELVVKPYDNPARIYIEQLEAVSDDPIE